MLSYIAPVIIGLSLGLIGGGGSILTVPVLVYLFHINPILSTAYSLFVVGCSSLVGAVHKFNIGEIDLRTGIIFSIPSLVAVYITRRYLVPALPDTFFYIGKLEITKDLGILIFFAIVMIIAAIFMLSRKNTSGYGVNVAPQYNYPIIGIEGFIIGILTGIVGAGGGFLIVPALVLITKLPMRTAIGTSLLIIAIKSIIGFIGDIQAGQNIDWIFLLTFTSLAIVGIFIGSYINKFIPGKKLKRTFGWFVLVMAIYILYIELFVTL